MVFRTLKLKDEHNLVQITWCSAPSGSYWLEEDNIHTEMVDDGSMTKETVTTTPTDGGAWSMAAI